MMSEELTAIYMKEKVLKSGEWKQKGGLYWSRKKGTRTLKEAYGFVVTSKIVNGYTKAYNLN